MRRSYRTPSLLTIAVLAFGLAIAFNSNVATSSNVVQGDADCSQDVDVEDVGAVLARAASLTGELPCETAANVDCDGEISARDALSILRFVGGVEDEPPEYCTNIGDALGDVLISIDPSLEPSTDSVESLEGGPPKPVEVVVGADGVQVEFIQGEIVYKADNAEDLQDFLEDYDATVIRDGTTSIAGQPGAIGAASIDHGYNLLALDDPGMELGGLADDLAAAGIEGNVAFSSEAGARLMALAASDPDGNVRLSGVIQELTEEHPNGSGGFLDAAQMNYFQSGSGLDIGVTEAWRYLRYQNIVLAEDSLPGQAVRVAIIDRGFALHQVTGLPLGGNRDYFPYGSKPLQHDAVDGDLTAGGLSPSGNWHGSGSFGICCAIADNQYGTSGTAGPYVQPVLIRIDNRDWVLGEAIRLAQLYNVEVMSLSVGFGCSVFCGYLEGGMGDSLTDFASKGGIAVAAAGNDGDDIGGFFRFRPCEFPAVVCVGSVDHEGKNVYNWGSPVDIWAPYGLYSTVTPASAATPGDNDNVGIDELYYFEGTSSSTPFVAGIVAMMKAVNPGLNKNGIISILQDTAHQVSDPKVAHGYINAKAAVLAAQPNVAPLINDVRAPLSKETYNYSGELFRIDGYDPEPGAYLPEFMTQTVAAFLVDGDLLCVTNQLSYRDGLQGYECFIKDAPLGTHDVTIEVRDPFMGIRTVKINEVTFVNTPPLVEVIKPDDGETFYATQSIDFSAFVFDPEEPIPFPQSRIVWESDLDGEIGTGSTFEANLSQGNHTVTVTATDTKGVATAVSFSLNILSGAGVPIVEITAPPDGKTDFFGGQQITFMGNATDPEDGPLTGDSLDWYSNIDGYLGSGGSLTTTLSSMPTCQVPYHEHTITLIATDSDANQVSDKITIAVSIFC